GRAGEACAPGRGSARSRYVLFRCLDAAADDHQHRHRTERSLAGLGGGTGMKGLQATSVGQAVCATCGRLGSPATDRACQRCGAALHFRKPNSIQRSWALLIAAYALYLPANLLPIMETRSLFGTQ